MSAELPGQYPFTRGIYPDMYRSRLWTMRQYAGFGTAEESNRALPATCCRKASPAFRSPSICRRRWATTPTIRWPRAKSAASVSRSARWPTWSVLFDGIPLRRSLDVDDHQFDGGDPAGLLRAVAQQQGADAAASSRGTIQNDILKEYIARGTYIYPPRPAMRIITDIFAWAGREMPEWNTISISGYHIREAGSTAVQELAFTFANAIAYIEAALAAGLRVDSFAPRLSFFFNSHNDFLEEIAKFRAARRIYAHLMRDRFGAQRSALADAALSCADRRVSR